MISQVELMQGDALACLKRLPDQFVDCVMTSPPYWHMRDYEVKGQIGLEVTSEQYLVRVCAVFDEVKRVLKDEGTCWVNMGDVYIKKSLAQIPNRFAYLLTRRGWDLRNEIIWHKSNIIPPSNRIKRCGVDFEKLFFFTKSGKDYYFKIAYEPTAGMNSTPRMRILKVRAWETDSFCNRNRTYASTIVLSSNPLGRVKRCVWKLPSASNNRTSHNATYSVKLCEAPLEMGCPKGGLVLDPFSGTGTTGVAAVMQGKRYIGIDLNAEYCSIAKERIKKL